MSKDQQAAAWSEFWRTGALHSCVGSFGADAYGGAIGAFWGEVLDGMAPEARVLDVGTGNGPLPRLIAHRFAEAASSMPSVDAIDVAALAPGWHDPAAYPRIRFHPRTSASALPFEDGAFDWVISQYGFEYADFPDAADECARVLGPRGQVAMVLHHAGSVICRVGREELANYGRVLAPGGLVEAARAVVPHFAAAAAGMRDPAAEAARAGYNAAMTAIGQAIEAAAVPDLLVEARQTVHGWVMAARERPATACIEALGQYQEALRQGAVRTQDMLDSALDAVGIERVATRLAGATEAVIEYRPLAQAEGLLGWGLRIRRGG